MDTVSDLPISAPSADQDVHIVAESSEPVEAETWADRIGTFRSGATGLTGADLAVLAAVFFLPCAFLPVFLTSWWTPRMMLLLAVIPAGVLALVRLVRSKDTAARWAAAAIVIAIVSGLASNSISASLKGYVGQNTSVLIFVGAFSLWALARLMSPSGKRLVAPVLLAAFGVNLFIGTMQVVARIEGGYLALQAGRADGFTPNPVYFGALMAAGTALCLHRLSTVADHRRAWAAGAFAFSAGVAFSGSRVALLAVAVVALYCVVRFDRVWAAIGLIFAVGGVATGSFLVRTFVSGRDSVSRLGEGSASGGRIPVWRAAGEAVTERPILGWGIGRFRYATQGRLSLEDMAASNGSSFFDAHNIVIGLAVAVGVPGLVCFLGFAWSTMRRLSPGIGLAVAAIAMTWTLQPVSITTLPLVFALVGVWSEPRAESLEELAPRWRHLTKCAVGLGVTSALALGALDYAFNAAVENKDNDRVLALEPLYMRDPVVANAVAQSLSFQFDVPDSREEMFEALQRSVDYEPTRVHWWNELARYQGFFGDHEAALASARQALELEPFEQYSWYVVSLAAQGLGDEALEREAIDMLCQLQVEGACEQTVGAGQPEDDSL